MTSYRLWHDSALEDPSTLSEYSPLTRALLLRRGITDSPSAEAFLAPQYDAHVHDPFLLYDMEKAVSRIERALLDNERIVIFSDYDTDGIPGAVILSDYLLKAGHTNTEVYIPHRNLEGFGLSTSALDACASRGATLVITIDCGINNADEVDHANRLGLDVIITDHHLPHDVLPSAYAIINPKQGHCTYPFKDLCGSGVIFKVVQALASRSLRVTPKGWEKWLLDMVGIATVSDMVPLLGENRVFAYYGLQVLRKSPRPGLKALFDKTRTSQKHLDEDDIGFTIGPRINAASRMDEPMHAFNLLSERDVDKGYVHFEHLDGLNNERKGIVASMVKALKKKIHARSELGSVIVSGDPLWKPSLLGLACNSLVEEFRRPVFLWGRESGSVYKGSCRSDGSVSVVDLMNAVTPGVFIEYGGHHMSGGFSLNHDHLHTLEESLSTAGLSLDTKNLDYRHVVDYVLSVSEVTWSLYDEIVHLGPFGMDNPKPLFLINDAHIVSAGHFGKTNNHLKLLVRDEGSTRTVEAIQFFKTSADYPEVTLAEGSHVSLLVHVEKSVFGYKPQLRLRIVDLF